MSEARDLFILHLFIQTIDDYSHILDSNLSVSTKDMLTQGIMNEHILELVK